MVVEDGKIKILSKSEKINCGGEGKLCLVLERSVIDLYLVNESDRKQKLQNYVTAE